MAIALDATGSGSGSAGTTVTFSHICAASAYLTVTVLADIGSTVSGVTYNGVALTRAVNNDTANGNTSVWVLDSPASGANNVVITKTSGANCAGGSVSFTGAAGYSASGTNNGNSSAQSVTVNTDKTIGYVVSGCFVDAFAGAFTYSGSGTQYQTFSVGGDKMQVIYHSFSGGSNITENFATESTSVPWATVGLEIYEASTFKPIIMSF